MRIFAKKAFRFDHPAGDEPAEIVSALSFADVPDWVSDSAMFKLAQLDESVSVIEDKQDEVKAELNAETNVKKGKKDADNQP